MRSIVGACGSAAALFVGPVVIAAPAHSDETIYVLGDDAACRNADGKIVPPPIAPTTPIAAENPSYGMVKVKGAVNGRDCFFYMHEVDLKPPREPPKPCPKGSISQEKPFVSGTRGPKGCSK